ncbi:MAG: laccase domain-containing protein [Clostridia bacterium]|nr:laccase domain-containing protein [Clostridia bacterium]
MIKILFVCHGNICRSPIAEFVMKDLIERRGLESGFLIESAATSSEEIWRGVGNPVYPPAQKTLKKHFIGNTAYTDFSKKRARQLTKSDYDHFDLLICMDENNMRNTRRMLGIDIGKDAEPAKVIEGSKLRMLLEFADDSYERKGCSVADPWYTGDFSATWTDVLAGCEGLLKLLMSEEYSEHAAKASKPDAGQGWTAFPTDLRVFSAFPELFAGFTRVPTIRIENLKQWVGQCGPGEYVIKTGQVHGKDILRVDEEFLRNYEELQSGTVALNTFGETDTEYPEKTPHLVEKEGYDAIVTDIPGVLLTTGHGDCIPVWLYDPVLKVAGVAHAGWKGTKLGIAGALAEEMKREYGCRPEDIVAYIGPGIGKCCFEVSEDVRAQFAEIPWGIEFITDDVDKSGRMTGKSHIDLKGINRRWLENSGLKTENIDISDECTCCDSKHYYSYRRDKDMRRMAAYIALRN